MLDYASWVGELKAEQIAQMYQRFSGGSLSAAFRARFDVDLDEAALNQSHQVVLVASDLDAATERIVRYLNKRGVAVKVLFFQVFQHGDAPLLSRAWLLDPGATQANVAVTASSAGEREREPWNGEFYVSFGDTHA